jgi:phospholipase C
MKRLACLLTLALLAPACGDDSGSPPDAAHGPDANHADGGAADAGACQIQAPTPTTLTCPGTAGATSSNIKHLVVIVQENHTFDAYFGKYCDAAPGSNPTCHNGPMCCEAAPATEPMGASPVVLDDAKNGSYDPNHSFDCEITEVNGGLMDGFVTGVPACASPDNFAIADATGSPLDPYRTLASTYALADHYFQPVIGASSANDMYLARGAYVFKDNTVNTKSIGSTCSTNGNKMSYTDTTVADLLNTCNVPWVWYSGGYQIMKDMVANGMCPNADPMCPVNFAIYPCIYDPTDVPFQFYDSLKDDPAHFKDINDFFTDIAAGNLAPVTFVKPIGFETEHTFFQIKLSTGVTRVQQILTAVNDSQFAADTLVILVYDEGGGEFDHVSPPATSTVDCQPYGTRVPMLAIGNFAKANYISHVQMEHSSIVKFIEWNWLGAQTGQLGTRDTQVNNIGDMLDPAKTGTAVPSN